MWLILAGYIRGDALNALGAKVNAAVFADQRPDIWNEELLGRILLNIFKFKIREFLKVNIYTYNIELSID